jgi:hypothetical protein
MTTKISFNKGEQPIENAPVIKITEQLHCIPQHYLSYAHSRETIEKILSNITCDDRYLLFVDEDGDVPFIQVGIIGYDNYKTKQKQPGKKIVFGRKWRVEPNLPTSEIIQTAFLAIKKAAEHELREKFVLITEAPIGQSRKTTPFNSHRDLPLLCRYKDTLAKASSRPVSVETMISKIKFNNGHFVSIGQEKRATGQWIVDLRYEGKNDFGLNNGEILTFLLPELTEDSLLHGLMRTLIEKSEQFIDEHFKFRNFALFSQKNSISEIANLSLIIRGSQSDENCLNAHFDASFAQEQYDTDASRVPTLNNSDYSNALRRKIKTLNIRAGFCPE